MRKTVSFIQKVAELADVYFKINKSTTSAPHKAAAIVEYLKAKAEKDDKVIEIPTKHFGRCVSFFSILRDMSIIK